MYVWINIQNDSSISSLTMDYILMKLNDLNIKLYIYTQIIVYQKMCRMLSYFGLLEFLL